MRNACIVCVALAVCSCGGREGAVRGQLLSDDGRTRLELAITVADTEYERREGLRLNGPLGEGEGLLLVFPNEGPVCITNAGVPFTIDVVYVSADGRVAATEPDIAPNAPGPFCHPDTAMALELRGGALGGVNYVKLELL